MTDISGDNISVRSNLPDLDLWLFLKDSYIRPSLFLLGQDKVEKSKILNFQMD